MSTQPLTPEELAKIAANHERVRAFGDRGRTADIFAGGLAEENFALVDAQGRDGETFAQRCERAAVDLASEEPEQGQLF